MLNKSEPYGEVCGGNSPVRYVQNHKFYNAQFMEVNEKGEVIEVATEAAPENKPAPKMEETPPEVAPEMEQEKTKDDVENRKSPGKRKS